MKYIIIAALILYVSSKQVTAGACDCDEIPSKIECNQGQCEWNSTDKKCENEPPVDCHVITGHQTCRTQQSCAWYNGECKAFTQCDQYTEDLNNLCNDINYTCEENQTSTKCQIIKPSAKCAEKEATATECTYGSDGFCILSGDPQTCALYSNCGQADSESMCLRNGSCIFKDAKCQTKTCVDIQTQADCIFVPEFNFNRLTICEWKDGKCQEGDVGELTEETCFTNTGRSHVWRDDSCKPCTYGTMLGMIMTLLLILW